MRSAGEQALRRIGEVVPLVAGGPVAQAGMLLMNTFIVGNLGVIHKNRVPK